MGQEISEDDQWDNIRAKVADEEDARPEVVPNRRVVLLGIGGASNSGKSTLAASLRVALACPRRVLQLDRYFKPRSDLPPHVKYGENWEIPDALEFERLRGDVEAILARIKKTLQEDPRSVPVCPLNPGVVFVIVEGFLLFADPSVAERFDICLWVEAPQEVCRERRFRRDFIKRYRVDEQSESGRFMIEERKPKFVEWYDDLVWHHYLEFRDVQKEAMAACGCFREISSDRPKEETRVLGLSAVEEMLAEVLSRD